MRHVAKRMSEAAPVGPVSEPVFLILLSLAQEPRHGYSIAKDVEELSQARVMLSTGTLYGALKRLLDNGWIERFEESNPGRERHAYRLTNVGRAALVAEAERFRSLAKLSTRLVLQGAKK